MLDESQWVAVACAIAALLCQEPESDISRVIKEVAGVYISTHEHNNFGTMFTDKYVEHVYRMIPISLKSFCEGIQEESFGDRALYKGLINISDIFYKEVFDGYPRPGSVIDEYTRSLTYHYFTMFQSELAKYNLEIVNMWNDFN